MTNYTGKAIYILCRSFLFFTPSSDIEFPKLNYFLFSSWKELLPALFETLENEKSIVYADTEVSGSEYKSLIVKSICNYQWNVDLLPSLTKMFG